MSSLSPIETQGEAKPDAAPGGESQRCSSARERAALLNSSSPLTIERGGKIVELTAAERAAELRIATTTIESVCTPPAGGQ